MRKGVPLLRRRVLPNLSTGSSGAYYMDSRDGGHGIDESELRRRPEDFMFVRFWNGPPRHMQQRHVGLIYLSSPTTELI